MQKIIKIIILFIFFFVVGIFYISLTRDTNYNTSSLINKETPEFKIISFDESNFYTRDDLKKMNVENKCDGCKAFYSDVDPVPAVQTGLRVRQKAPDSTKLSGSATLVLTPLMSMVYQSNGT